MIKDPWKHKFLFKTQILAQFFFEVIQLKFDKTSRFNTKSILKCMETIKMKPFEIFSEILQINFCYSFAYKLEVNYQNYSSWQFYVANKTSLNKLKNFIEKLLVCKRIYQEYFFYIRKWSIT